MNKNSTFISIAFALIALILSGHSVAQTSFENQTIDGNFNSPAGIYSADIDMDGDIDVIAGSAVTGIILWINERGDPVNWSRQVVDLASGVCLTVLTVFIADIIRDGLPDIVAASTDKNQIIYYKNHGGDPISWSKHIISTDVGEPHEIFVCDFDLDGNQDVFAASMGSNEISWWHNDGGDPAQWTMQVISGNEPGARSVHVGDIDGDGDNDVAGATYDTDEVVWWKNEGGDPVNWTRNVLSDSFDGSHRIQIADMDSDGDMDILGTAYMAAEISIWRNDDGAGNVWTKHVVDNAFTGAVIGYAVDINSDGFLDVLGTAQASNTVAWYENKGETDPGFKKTVLTDDFDGVWPAHAGDYDNDFDIDLLVGGFDANEIRWYKNKQVGRFTNNIKIDGVPTNLGFFVPEEYDPTQAYKLIVALHICGDENEYSRYRDNLIQLCLESNTILVAPDCHNSVTNVVLPEVSYILEAIEYATKRFNIDEEYVYLTGGSCNGRTTLKYGLEKIYDFRGVIPFNAYIPGWSEGYYDFTSDMPVCFASGTSDPNYTRTQEVYNQLMQNQGKARFLSMQGVGHDFYFPEFSNVMLQCINYIDSIAGSISSTGKVLEVPGDFQSISEAIAAAAEHDTILVSQGTYYENLNFSGKNIVLASHYVYSKDLRDIENTIIDGSSPANPDSASCLIFCKGEVRTAVVEGFTITDGLRF